MRGARNRMAAAVAASSLLWGGFTTSAPAAEVSTATLDTVRSVGGYPVRYHAVATAAETDQGFAVTASCQGVTDGSWLATDTWLRVQCYLHDALRATDTPLQERADTYGFGLGTITGVGTLPSDGTYFLCMGASVEWDGEKFVGPDVCTPFTSAFTTPDVTKVVPGLFLPDDVPDDVGTVTKVVPGLVLPDDLPNVPGTAVIAGAEQMGPYGGHYLAATQGVHAGATSEEAYLSACSMPWEVQSNSVSAWAICWLRDVATGEKTTVSRTAANGPVVAGGSVVTVPAGRSYELCMQGFAQQAGGTQHSGPVRCERVTEV